MRASDGRRVPGLSTALAVSSAADAWVSAALGRDLRLTHLPEDTTRPVSPEHGGLESEVTGLAWDAPLHLVTQESLDQFATWIGECGDDQATAVTAGDSHAGLVVFTPALLNPAPFGRRPTPRTGSPSVGDRQVQRLRP